MRKLENIVGKTFNRLHVLAPAERRHNKAHWKCECSCGKIFDVENWKLKSGHTKSCGCHRQDMRIKHGLSKTPEYRSWLAMMSRCYIKKTAHFKRYGGAGVTVCDEWHDFTAFLSDMGKRPKGYTIDRIESSGNYTPDNCRWATHLKQVQNRKTTIWIEHLGRTQTLKQWVDELGIVGYSTASGRINRGWKPVDAITIGPRRHASLTVTV